MAGGTIGNSVTGSVPETGPTDRSVLFIGDSSRWRNGSITDSELLSYKQWRLGSTSLERKDSVGTKPPIHWHQ